MGETEEGNVGLKVWLSSYFRPQISSFGLKLSREKLLKNPGLLRKQLSKRILI